MSTLFSPQIAADAKIDALREFFLSWGPWAPLAYILFVTAEVVVAPLPGLMLYAPGGIIFGGFLGGLYSLMGNLLGAAIACQVMRLLGHQLFGSGVRQSLEKLTPLIEKRGIWIVFFLRVNPFTSSDLVSYAAGLTPMPVWKVVLGTALGMAPLCWLQSYLAEGLMEAFPALVYPLLAACGIYALAVVWAIRKMMQKPVQNTTT
jgi:uncharacterized membrane protein YdjX (TVP38/TMEM64 family)